nr:MAG TPA: capsid protein [Cressdnaviricota sp.]
MGFVRRVGRNLGNELIGPKATQLIERTLFAKKSRAALLTPGKALKSTALGSYLDKTYTRKCGVEVKIYDNAYSYTLTGTLALVPTTAPVNGLNIGIAQGLTASTRLGDSIETKSLEIRGHFYCPAATTTPGLIRVFVVRQGASMAGVVLAATNILQTTSAINSQYTLKANQNQTFQVLHERFFPIGLVGSDKGIVKFHFKWYPKGCSATKWSTGDTTGSLTTMNEGLLNVFMMYTGCATAAPIFVAENRLQYIDV